ncbi:MAG: hypothetical protein FWC47_07000 [Oscillospiraceae bacterium]|nr:hypothetical protein [Oscillospiraceae bacterium]
MKKLIALDVWESVPDEKGLIRYAYGRNCLDVFNELRQYLEEIGYIPDEYFILDSYWEHERIPKDAILKFDIDYGSSEGIYIDLYINWNDSGEAHSKHFITGKTLNDNDEGMDKMFLIASNIRKVIN